MKGTGRVHDDLNSRGLDDLVESPGLSDIRDDRNIETIGLVLVRIPDLLGLVLGPNRGGDLVALVKELLENMR